MEKNLETARALRAFDDWATYSLRDGAYQTRSACERAWLAAWKAAIEAPPVDERMAVGLREDRRRDEQGFGIVRTGNGVKHGKSARGSD